MLKRLIEKALTKTVDIQVQISRSGPKKRQRTAKVQTVEIPPSQKLIYGMYFMMMFFTALTAIQIVHVIFLGCFNNEIFHLMNTLISIIVGVFFGAKV